MKQAQFEKYHDAFWQHCAQAIMQLTKNAKEEQQQRQLTASTFPADYRRLCQHLAIAKSRRYSPLLINHLNQLVKDSYDIIYSSRYRRSGQLIQFIAVDFPAVIQANLRFVLIATAFFLIPGLLMGLACYLDKDMLYTLMDPGTVRSFESMYDPDLRKLGRERQSDSDLMMFGFYIYNNIGISFKCFASGLLFGVGTLFVLVFNGLFIGGAAGHITNLGFTETFYPFVITHGAFELTAIVFSGAAGLKLGYALISPGAYSRLLALQLAAKEAIKIIYGSTLMLFVAAFIEAYWSSSTELTITVKITAGASLWFLVFYYCFFSGRKRAA